VRVPVARAATHDLGHSFASLLLQQGESFVYVKDGWTRIDSDCASERP
jgi:hypothetical protein